MSWNQGVSSKIRTSLGGPRLQGSRLSFPHLQNSEGAQVKTKVSTEPKSKGELTPAERLSLPTAETEAGSSPVEESEKEDSEISRELLLQSSGKDSTAKAQDEIALGQTSTPLSNGEKSTDPIVLIPSPVKDSPISKVSRADNDASKANPPHDIARPSASNKNAEEPQQDDTIFSQQLTGPREILENEKGTSEQTSQGETSSGRIETSSFRKDEFSNPQAQPNPLDEPVRIDAEVRAVIADPAQLVQTNEAQGNQRKGSTGSISLVKGEKPQRADQLLAFFKPQATPTTDSLTQLHDDNSSLLDASNKSSEGLESGEVSEGLADAPMEIDDSDSTQILETGDLDKNGNNVKTQIEAAAPDALKGAVIESKRDNEVLPSKPPLSNPPQILSDLSPEAVILQIKYFHMARDPNTLSVDEPVFCLECGEKGHVSEHCPRLICDFCKERNLHCREHCHILQRCSRCYQTGHDISGCAHKLKPDIIVLTCRLCDQTGHEESNCELQWRSSGRPWACEIPLLTVRRWCYECGQGGHLGNDCSTRRPGKQMGSSSWSFTGLPNPYPPPFRGIRDFAAMRPKRDRGRPPPLKGKGSTSQQQSNGGGDDETNFLRTRNHQQNRPPPRTAPMRIETSNIQPMFRNQQHPPPTYEAHPNIPSSSVSLQHPLPMRVGEVSGQQKLMSHQQHHQLPQPPPQKGPGKASRRNPSGRGASRGGGGGGGGGVNDSRRRSRSPQRRLPSHAPSAPSAPNGPGHVREPVWVKHRYGPGKNQNKDQRQDENASRYQPMPSAAERAWKRGRN